MSDENDDMESESEGIKGLRKQYEAQAKELKEAQARLAELDKAKRQSSVADILTAKGVSATAAKFYSDDDVSEDAVGKWVEAHADVFGINKAETDNSTPDPNAEAARRVAEASFGTSPDFASVVGRVADPEAAMRAIKTLPYEELVKAYPSLAPPRDKLWGR
jgi:hypothetical protein